MVVRPAAVEAAASALLTSFDTLEDTVEGRRACLATVGVAGVELGLTALRQTLSEALSRRGVDRTATEVKAT